MHRRNRNTEPQSPTAALIAGIFACCFGVLWTVLAASMMPVMAIFGILWTAIAVTNTVNGYKSAKKREENEAQTRKAEPEKEYVLEELRCPYCGAPIHRGKEKCEYCDMNLQ